MVRPLRSAAQPALNECLGGAVDHSAGIETPSDPHGQGELLGLGVRVLETKQLVRVDQFDLTTMTGPGGEAIAGVVVSAHAMEGWMLRASGPVRLTGAAWKGVTATGKLHCTGGTGFRDVRVRIVDVVSRPSSEVDAPSTSMTRTWTYQLALELDDHTAVKACGGGDDAAFAMAGHWDDTGRYVWDTAQLSFACIARGAAWCMREGNPDDRAQMASGASMFAACARMARADYCGDGQSYTREGTLVTIWKHTPAASPSKPATVANPARSGEATPPPEDASVFEAAWTDAGMVCMAHARWPAEDLGKALPDCVIKHASCDTREVAERIAKAPVLINGSCTPKPCLAKPPERARGGGPGLEKPASARLSPRQLH